MSSTANPYDHFLHNREPNEVIAATPQKLREFASELQDDRAERSYAAGKWNARQIICHLADVEIAFAFRLRQAIAETNHVIQPFDQSAWAAHYERADFALATNVFCTLRSWNLAFVESLAPDALSKPLSHPERGSMTFGTLLRTMAGHDLNHLSQLERIAEVTAVSQG